VDQALILGEEWVARKIEEAISLTRRRDPRPATRDGQPPSLRSRMMGVWKSGRAALSSNGWREFNADFGTTLGGRFQMREMKRLRLVVDGFAMA
jgi:hypothetical protein